MLTLLEKTQSIHTYTAGKKTQSIHAYIDETNLKAWNKPQKTYAYIVGKETPKELLICTHTHRATHTWNAQKSVQKETAHKICTHPSPSQLSLPFSPSCHLDPSSSWPCCCEGGGTAWHRAWPPVDRCQGEGDVGGTLAQSLSPRIHHLGWGRMLHEMAVNAKYITMDSLTQTGTARDITSVPETRCLQWAECSMKWLLRELSLSHLQCLGHHRTKTSMDALLKCVFFYICIKHDS